MRLHTLVHVLVALSLALLSGCSGSDDEKPGNNVCTDTNCFDAGDSDVSNNTSNNASACGTCSDDQVCDENTATCVECLVDAQCPGGAICDQVNNICACPQGSHFCDKACVPDDSANTCGDRCEPCANDPNGTPTCEAGACALDCTDGFTFDPAGARCVECAINTDCGADAPVCDAGLCAACTSSTDCEGRGATPVCEGTSGACVECTSEDNSACNGFVCDLTTFMCSQIAEGSLGPCEVCSQNSECEMGTKCVPAEYRGATRAETYCYPVKPMGMDCPGLGYGTQVMRTSLSAGAVEETFCAPNESLTTCEALRNYGSMMGLCQDGADCGVEGDDAVCDVIEFEFGAACSIPCESSSDCPSEFFGCFKEVGESVGWCGGF